MESLRFDGRVAVITGAGSNPGLGRTYALFLAERGAKIVVNDLGVGPDGRGGAISGAEDVASEIRALGGEAVSSNASVAIRDGAASIIDCAKEEWGRLDILINNAGIAPFASFEEISDEDIERVVDVHLMGHIWMCRAVWPVMKDQGYGRIVNVSSAVAVMGMPSQSIYASAKLGIVGLTRVLASEGEDYGIRANVILPAADTVAWQKMLTPEASRTAREHGLVPEVVAPVAAWLAHERCEFSGKAIQTQAGEISEIVFARTLGTPPTSGLTLEAVDGLMTAATDLDRVAFVPDPLDREVPAGAPTG